MGWGRFPVTNFEGLRSQAEACQGHAAARGAAETIRAEAGSLAFAAGLEVIEGPRAPGRGGGLVEWPVVLMGLIEERFLGLPPEVLQTSMKGGATRKFFFGACKTVHRACTGRAPGRVKNNLTQRQPELTPLT